MKEVKIKILKGGKRCDQKPNRNRGKKEGETRILITISQVWGGGRGDDKEVDRKDVHFRGNYGIRQGGH